MQKFSGKSVSSGGEWVAGSQLLASCLKNINLWNKIESGTKKICCDVLCAMFFDNSALFCK